MLENYVKLIFGTLLGGSATLFNVATTSFIENTVGIAICNIPFLNFTSTMATDIAVWVGILTAFFGFVSAVFTCTYMYFQIKKIRKDLKYKKLYGKYNQTN